jgi:hypothetical protein
VLANYTPRTKPACDSDTPPANSDNALSQSTSTGTGLTENTERYSCDVSLSQDTGSGPSHAVTIEHLSDGTLSQIPDSSPVLTSDLSLQAEDAVQTLTIESSASSACKVPGHTFSDGDSITSGVPVPTGGQTKYKNRTDAGEQKGKYFFFIFTYRYRMVPLSYLNKVRVSVPGPHGSALI